MFTGIIESIGTVKRITPKRNYIVLTVEHNLTSNDLNVGDSVACDGACLTVVSLGTNEFSFEISQETIACTIAEDYHDGTKINLERAVRVGDRLDGHFVTGHIDTVVTITKKKHIGESVFLELQYDGKFDNLVVVKGSIAVNGVSLTVNDTSDGKCSVNLIPYTMTHTNFEQLSLNDRVNIEFDLIGKYAVQSATSKPNSNLTFPKLTESGW